LKEYSPLMSKSIERGVQSVIKYGAVFAEVRSPIWTPSQTLTPFSSILSQRLSLELLASRLRFVLATGVSEAEVTLDDLALEGTK
jgi:hypothetical protein